MALSSARPKAKKPDRHQLQQELCRQYREAENEDSPLLKLPGELRNEIYELAIPRDWLFTTDSFNGAGVEGIEPGVIYCSISIQDKKAYKRKFATTQVCRQIRDETLPLVYGSNIFMLHVSDQKQVTATTYTKPKSRNSSKTTDAYTWILSRPTRALAGLSQIVLVWHDRSKVWTRGGLDMVYFDFRKPTFEILFAKWFRSCDCPPKGDKLPDCDCDELCRNTIERGRKTDFGKVIEEYQMNAPEEMSAAKLLKLVQAFRNCF